MTAQDFVNLESPAKQIQVALDAGKFVASRKTDAAAFQLYQVDGFYVEIKTENRVPTEIQVTTNLGLYRIIGLPKTGGNWSNPLPHFKEAHLHVLGIVDQDNP